MDVQAQNCSLMGANAYFTNTHTHLYIHAHIEKSMQASVLKNQGQTSLCNKALFTYHATDVTLLIPLLAAAADYSSEQCGQPHNMVVHATP